MQRSRAIINDLIFEAANLDRGLVAVELEVLIRNDLGVAPISIGDNLYSDELVNLARRCGFNVVGDASVKRVQKEIHREKLYQNCEFNSALKYKLNPDGTPVPGTGRLRRWSEVLPGLTALLSWLKQKDVVNVLGGKIVNKVSGATLPKGDPRKPIPYPLPRARLPVNSSAGLHVHFDVETWFDDDQHAKRFVLLWNSIRQSIPRHLPVARYGEPGMRGHRYATLDPMEVPTDYETAVFKKEWVGKKLPGGAMARQYFGLIPQRHRYWAVNTNMTLTRGDIEFRFIHATMNVGTIEGWVRALAELIEYSRKPFSSTAPPDIRAGFAKYVHNDAKDTAGFLTRSARHYAKSKDPETLLTKEPSRIDRKLFRKPEPSYGFQTGRGTQRGAQARGRGAQVHVDEPELVQI